MQGSVMYNLKVITVSTRQGRKGPIVADWILSMLKDRQEFNTIHIDLAEVNLPLLDEPHHPVMMKYTQQHTKDWSKMIIDGDAYIFVAPEYNYGFSSSFKNAIDYLYREWQYKPVGIVAYGGVAAGTRATQMMKQTFTTISMMPINESVNIPFFEQFIKDGKFEPNGELVASAENMFKSLLMWTKALKTMREENNLNI